MTGLQAPGRKVAGKLFGTEALRVEDPKLLRGEGQYLADVKLHGMLHAALLRSPLPHARITGIDATEARASAGVVDVVLGAELPEFAGMPTLVPLPQLQPFLHPVLAVDEVCYVGQPVAVVVAHSRHEAEDAAERIIVDYEPVDAVVDPEQAALPDSTPVHLDIPSNVVDTETVATGDITELNRAPHRISRRFRIQRHAGVPLETRGVLAEWDARLDQLRVWSSTQGPHQLRDCVAGYLSLDPHLVHVIVPDVGGAFGTKFNLYPEEALVPFLARRIGRPVKWIEDRVEHMASATHGREQVHEVEVGYEVDGRITAIRDVLVAPIGAFSAFIASEEASLTMTMLRGPYRIPNFEATVTRVVTNTAWLNPFRAVGQSQAVFVMERLIDEVARSLGLDPVEVRLRNMIGADEMPADRGIAGMLSGPIVYESGDFPAALRKALDIARYDELVQERDEARADGRFLGIGIAPYVEITAIGPFETATTRVDPSGSVVIGLGTTGSGQGHQTTFAQIAADELGVPMDQITVVSGDTSLVRSGIGAFASRSAAVCGAAVRRSSAAVREKALRVAADMLEAAPEDLELRDGAVRVVGSPDSAVPLADVAARVAPGAPLPEGIDSHELNEADHFVPPAASFSYGTQVAVAEVDVETGFVELRLIVMVHDAGRLINPMLVRGQMHGGIVLGIGTALLEDIGYTSEGQPVTTFMDYLLPDCLTVPEIRLGHVEIPTANNPDGIRGVGEAGVLAAPAAIVNAVVDALAPLDVTISEMPLTPQRVLGLIDEARRGVSPGRSPAPRP